MKVLNHISVSFVGATLQPMATICCQRYNRNYDTAYASS
jgi:hypothetical protein